jgi:hypothetical protein
MIQELLPKQKLNNTGTKKPDPQYAQWGIRTYCGPDSFREN